jgi:hypothetical protein
MFKQLRRIVILCVAAGCLSSVWADTFNEVGDAGELLATANVASVAGPLTAISGTLIDLGGGTDDVDLYQILISNPGAFSVTVNANLSVDNDTRLFLFDAAGSLVLFDEDSGGGFLPQFDAGDLSGSPGVYYLGFSLFETTPALSGNVLTGWNRAATPFQTGPYTLTLTGAGSISTVIPEPGSVVLFSIVLLGTLPMVSRRFSARKRQQ